MTREVALVHETVLHRYFARVWCSLRKRGDAMPEKEEVQDLVLGDISSTIEAGVLNGCSPQSGSPSVQCNPPSVFNLPPSLEHMLPLSHNTPLLDQNAYNLLSRPCCDPTGTQVHLLL